MITVEQARQKALADGILPEHITQETLVAYGLEITDPTATFTPTQIVLTEEQKADIAAAQAEIKANSVGPVVDKAFKVLLSVAKATGIALALCVCVLLSGCTTVAAQKLEAQRDKIAIGMNQQHLDFENGLIADFQAKSIANAQAILDAAMKSNTVNGAVPVDVVQGLQKRRDDLLLQIASTVQLQRTKQATICANMANYMAYSAAMNSYLKSQEMNFDNMAAGLQSVQDLITSLTVKTPAKAASP